VLDTGRFDFETATRSPGWKREIAESEGEHGHEPAAGQHEHDHAEGAAAAHGVDSFVYRSADALDPESFANWLHDWDGAIVRAKGVANVAGTDEVIGVSQAGPSVQAGDRSASGARRRPPHATRVHRQRDGRSADPRRARRTGGVEP